MHHIVSVHSLGDISVYIMGKKKEVKPLPVPSCSVSLNPVLIDIGTVWLPATYEV